MCIGAEDSANSSINFYVRVFLSVLIFQYNFYHKFTKLNLCFLLILSSLRASAITSMASQRVINQIKSQKLPELNVFKKNEHGYSRKGRNRHLIKVSLCIGVLLKILQKDDGGTSMSERDWVINSRPGSPASLTLHFPFVSGQSWQVLVTVL